MINLLDNAQIIKMFKGAYQNLMLNKDLVDSLNVFPVPDGDTGTNMGLTMTSTVKEMEAVNSEDVPTIMNAIAKGALKGARGNSGVILSQIFKGITQTFVEAKVYNTKTFAKGMVNGSAMAYNAVTQPKEGTILTVIRMMSEYAIRIAVRTTDFESFFKKIIDKGIEVLDDTPNMLEVLKKAGVVDSGGQGLIFIFIGMYNVLAGIEMKAVDLDSETKESEKVMAFDNDVHDLENIKFTYCTEFFILNIKKQTTMADIDKLRDKLTLLGDCVLVIGDLELIKVHLHTNQPNIALGYALELGELNLPKIENMKEQNRQLKSKKKAERKQMALISVCSGDGFRTVFEELNADAVLEGGQTMNPSVDDIVKIVNSVNANNVFILPNNKNIILACEQAKDLVGCNLVVIATVNVAQGVAAAMNFNNECTDVEQLKEAMDNSIKAISCIQVTHAVRETTIDGFSLKMGDIIALEKNIIAKGDNVDNVVIDALNTKDAEDVCVITMFYGEDVKEADAEKLQNRIMELFPNSDVLLLYGGQPHYYYLLSIE
ncbi:MAG: DAK2 domain-containing protein [Clostridia bacterium]